MHKFQAFINHRNKTICAFAPRVTIGNFFNYGGFLSKTLLIFAVTDLNIHREIRTDIKRRVNVNQFQTALCFYFFTKWTIFEGGKNDLVVSPNKLVRPSSYLSARRVKKRVLITKFCITSR